MANRLIAISGKKRSGKDTLGKIFQACSILEFLREYDLERRSKFILNFIKNEESSLDHPNQVIQIKKFADEIKDLMCVWFGCSRRDLEDECFKNSNLPEEWWYYVDSSGNRIPYEKSMKTPEGYLFVVPTYRNFMEDFGTNACRYQVHPDMWVNIFFKKHYRKDKDIVITDTRFPNEVERVEQKNGYTVRIQRNTYNNFTRYTDESVVDMLKEVGYEVTVSNFNLTALAEGYVCLEDNIWIDKHEQVAEHESETALDDYQGWDFKVDNNDSLEDLIRKGIIIWDVITENVRTGAAFSHG